MDALKNAVISAHIVGKMCEGLTVAEAIDAVIGDGTFQRIASELYDTLHIEGVTQNG